MQVGILSLSNSQVGWNKGGGGAKVAKSINVEKKLVHNCYKQGVVVEKI